MEEMNKTSADLQLKGSYFDSPHGLINWVNRSTAFDIAKLCSIAMKNMKFRQIVSTKYYKVSKNTDMVRNSRAYSWENT
jgi:D-alanyl-D-alanine carboxypeptidase